MHQLNIVIIFIHTSYENTFSLPPTNNFFSSDTTQQHTDMSSFQDRYTDRGDSRRGDRGGDRGERDDKPPFSRLFIVCGKHHNEEDLREAFRDYGQVEVNGVLRLDKS